MYVTRMKASLSKNDSQFVHKNERQPVTRMRDILSQKWEIVCNKKESQNEPACHKNEIQSVTRMTDSLSEE